MAISLSMNLDAKNAIQEGYSYVYGNSQ